MLPAVRTTPDSFAYATQQRSHPSHPLLFCLLSLFFVLYSPKEEFRLFNNPGFGYLSPKGNLNPLFEIQENYS